MRFITKTKVILFVTVLVAITASVGAYAYFTSTGSGSGTATVGTSTAFVIHGTSGSTLYPGTTSAVTFTVDNPSTGHQKLGTIYLSAVKACPSGSAWDANASDCTNSATEITGCESVDDGSIADANTSDFYMADVAVNTDYATGNTQTVTPGGTLKMNNLSSSQDACKSAALYLVFATR
jgi:hypothetical protein